MNSEARETLSKQFPNLPATVYKYRKWDLGRKDGNDFKLLSVPEAYFSSPKGFNDPFDCKLPQGFWKMDKESIVNLLRSNSNLDKSHVEETIRRLEENPQKEIFELERRFMTGTIQTTGVFSTSRVCDSILMWSHYAESHTGICIGLDAAVLMKDVMKHLVKMYNRTNKTFRLLPFAFPVEYSNLIPEMSPFAPKNTIEDVDDSLLRPLKNKFVGWEYESEFRFVLRSYPPGMSKEERTVLLSPESIVSVLIGEFTTDEAQKEILERVARISEDRRITVSIAYTSIDKYGLNFDPISY